MAFLSYVQLADAHDMTVTAGVLCPIPNRCRKCAAFRTGGCATTSGMSQCRRGYSVYYDDRLHYMFFGARVEGYHDTSRITSKKTPIYLTQRQFAALVRYDSQKYDRSQIESMVDVFSSQYDTIIQQIKCLLPRYDQESIVNLSYATVDKICNAVGALDDLKRSTEAFVFHAEPFLLFPMVADNVETVFKAEEICRNCGEHTCERIPTTEEFACHMCENGCSFFSFWHRQFYGIRIVGYFKKALCKSSIPRKQISRFDVDQIRLLTKIVVQQNELIYSIRQFLHDIGQYLFGMSNLLPIKRESRNGVSCAASDIRSIAAFVSALKSLKREYFRYRNPIMSTVRRHFEPFPLFYKYRLCFECRDVIIEVRDLNQEQGSHEHEMIEGPVGFEFVTLNLLSNAVKYLPSAEVKYRKIKILLRKSTPGLAIEISSWGPKIEKSEIAFLGTRGFRAKNARKVKTSGQGLGLSRVIAYVRSAGYEINFNSADEEIVCDGVPYSVFTTTIEIPAILCRGHRADMIEDISGSASFD